MLSLIGTLSLTTANGIQLHLFSRETMTRCPATMALGSDDRNHQATTEKTSSKPATFRVTEVKKLADYAKRKLDHECFS